MNDREDSKKKITEPNDLWDNTKWFVTHATRVPKKEKRQIGAEEIYLNKIINNVPYYYKENQTLSTSYLKC